MALLASAARRGGALFRPRCRISLVYASPQDAGEEAEEPHIAPDAAFEILSPSSRALHVAHKIDVYLQAGTGLVAIIDPATRTIRLIDRDGERTLVGDDIFEHAALPGFTFDIAAYFATLDR